MTFKTLSKECFDTRDLFTFLTLILMSGKGRQGKECVRTVIESASKFSKKERDALDNELVVCLISNLT